MKTQNKNNKLVQDANSRLLLAIAKKLLIQAQKSVANNTWIKDKMDVKINKFILPEYFRD